MLKMRTYFRFQIKDNQGALYVYVGVYVFLLVLAVWLRFLGAGDAETVYNLYGLNSNVSRICMLILAPMPILILSSEMIEKKVHPHLKIYGLRWNLTATLLGIGMSLAAPIIYKIIADLLFWKGIYYYIDLTPATGVNIFIDFVTFCILIMVLSGIAFFLGSYIGTVLMALVITLFYTLIVEFFTFDLYARDFSCLDVTVVTNTGGPGWWHWPLYWFILGVGFWVVGMINYKRK